VSQEEQLRDGRKDTHTPSKDHRRQPHLTLYSWRNMMEELRFATIHSVERRVERYQRGIEAAFDADGIFARVRVGEGVEKLACGAVDGLDEGGGLHRAGEDLAEPGGCDVLDDDREGGGGVEGAFATAGLY